MVDFLKEWQELIGAMTGAVATIVIAIVAIWGDFFKEQLFDRRAKISLAKLLNLLYFKLQDYFGGLAKATDQARSYRSLDRRVSPLPIRVPFPPQIESYLTSYGHLISADLSESAIDFEIATIELERVLERNGVGLILRLHPRNGEVAEAEIPAQSDWEIILVRINTVMESCETLLTSVERSAKMMENVGGGFPVS